MLKSYLVKKPLLFCMLLIPAWMLFSGIFAFAAGLLLDQPLTADIPQAAARVAGSLLILAFTWKMGWLKEMGISVKGKWWLTLLTTFIFIYLIFAGTLAYFGELPQSPAILANSPAAVSILFNQVFVALAEEFLFRGLILYILFTAWKGREHGALLSVFASAILFGSLHLIHIFFVQDARDVAIVLLNIVHATTTGVWLGLLVLLGASLWPAVFLHGAGNAAIFIAALSLPMLEPLSAYTRLMLVDLPLIALGLWMLKRKTSRLSQWQAEGLSA